MIGRALRVAMIFWLAMAGQGEAEVLGCPGARLVMEVALNRQATGWWGEDLEGVIRTGFCGISRLSDPDAEYLVLAEEVLDTYDPDPEGYLFVGSTKDLEIWGLEPKWTVCRGSWALHAYTADEWLAGRETTHEILDAKVPVVSAADLPVSGDEISVDGWLYWRCESRAKDLGEEGFSRSRALWGWLGEGVPGSYWSGDVAQLETVRRLPGGLGLPAYPLRDWSLAWTYRDSDCGERIRWREMVCRE